jgi:hypothetical protein
MPTIMLMVPDVSSHDFNSSFDKTIKIVGENKNKAVQIPDGVDDVSTDRKR